MAHHPESPDAGSPDADARGEREYAGTLIRRAGNIRYQHDPQGRVTLRQQKRLSAKPRTWHYTWNADDRLTAVTTPDGQHWRYSYDPLGRRIAKQRLAADRASVAEQTTFTWDGVILAEQIHTSELDDPGRTTIGRTITWEWEPDSFRPLTQTERAPLRDAPQEWVDEQFYAIVTDLVGTPTEMVDPDGTLVWHPRATLWGTTIGHSVEGASCPLRFPGQYFDPETQIHYNYHRYYDPVSSRYHGSDPIGLEGGFNPHKYVSNPINWIDPLGLAGCGRSTVGKVVDERGVKIKIYSNDHAPPHAHVEGGGGKTRIGQNGKPLKGDPELTSKQADVVEANRKEIRDAIGEDMRRFRENKS